MHLAKSLKLRNQIPIQEKARIRRRGGRRIARFQMKTRELLLSQYDTWYEETESMLRLKFNWPKAGQNGHVKY